MTPEGIRNMRDLMGPNAAPAVRNVWDQICAAEERKMLRLIAELQSIGVVAAHPDDGWVDRKEDHVTFVYPHFTKNVYHVGDLIALTTAGGPLGWDYRLVRLVEPKPLMFHLRTNPEGQGSPRWKFELVAPYRHQPQPPQNPRTAAQGTRRLRLGMALRELGGKIRRLCK